MCRKKNPDMIDMNKQQTKLFKNLLTAMKELRSELNESDHNQRALKYSLQEDSKKYNKYVQAIEADKPTLKIIKKRITLNLST